MTILLVLSLLAATIATGDMNVSSPQGICDSIHGLQCYGDDLKNIGKVGSHEECCQACQALPGCNAWTWNWQYGSDCYLKSACSDKRSGSQYHSGVGVPGPPPGPTPSPTPSPPTPPPPPPTPMPPLGKCEVCPPLQSFNETDPSQCRQNCPGQERFQWIKDLIAKGCNQVWQLEAKTYYIDRQYLLPCGVQIRGAGPSQTIIQAVRCEGVSDTYGLGTDGAKYRIGFVLNHNTSINGMSFHGADTRRYAKRSSAGQRYAGYDDLEPTFCHNGGDGFSDLQGGAGFETPGCSDPYACSQTPCINGKFTTPACYKWNPVEQIAVKNVVLENIHSINTNNGVFGAPLNEHLGFDLMQHRPSNIKILNILSHWSFADGFNLHGSFDQVLIDNYHVEKSGDDCIALWSYHSHMGDVTIKNSQANQCGYKGCYTVYGGSGPLSYSNDTCQQISSSQNCLWLQSQFDGQFGSDAHVSGVGFQCPARPCAGNAASFCPKASMTGTLVI